MSAPDMIVYKISRRTIESGSHDHIVKFFDVSQMSSKQIAEMQGRVFFCFSGYDTHPEELYAIEKVRTWIREWHQKWPYWLHFCTIQSDSIKILYLARLESLSSSNRKGSSVCEVQLDLVELIRLVMADLNTSHMLALDAGLSPVDIALRRDAIIRFFGLEGGAL